jgi:hypothetical protein
MWTGCAARLKGWRGSEDSQGSRDSKDSKDSKDSRDDSRVRSRGGVGSRCRASSWGEPSRGNRGRVKAKGSRLVSVVRVNRGRDKVNKDKDKGNRLGSVGRDKDKGNKDKDRDRGSRDKGRGRGIRLAIGMARVGRCAGGRAARRLAALCGRMAAAVGRAWR